MNVDQIQNLFPVKFRAKVPVREIAYILMNANKPAAAKPDLAKIISSLGIKSKQDSGKIANSLIAFESERRKLLIEASRPKECFEGTDFYLDVDLTSHKPKYKAYKEVLKRLVELNPNYGNIFQLPRLDKNSLTEALSFILYETRKNVEKNPDLANPKSDSYRPENLFYSSLFLEVIDFNSKIYLKNDEPFVKRADVLNHFKRTNILLHGDLELEKAITNLENDDRETLHWNDVRDLTGTSLNQACERAGLLILITPQGENFFGAIVPELNEVRKVGSLEIPVQYVVSLTGETLGQGYCRNSKVFLPADSLFFDEAIYEHNLAKNDAFEKSKLLRPKMLDAPSLLLPWVLALEAKSLDPTKVKETFKEHALAEELAHAYSEKYSKLISGNDATNDDLFSKIVGSILRPSSEAQILYNQLLKSLPNDSETISNGYVEIEGKAKALVDSPVPIRSLMEIISPVLTPISGNSMLASNKATCYDISTVYLFKALSEELLENGSQLTSSVDWGKLLNSVITGKVIAFKNSDWVSFLSKGTDSDGLNQLRKAWYEFFDLNITNLENFNKFVSSNRIQDAAKKIHETNFLSYAERETDLSKLS